MERILDSSINQSLLFLIPDHFACKSLLKTSFEWSTWLHCLRQSICLSEGSAVVNRAQSAVRDSSTQPHAAFGALTHRLSSKWSYVTRTTPINGNLLQPLDAILRSTLIPKLTGCPPPNDIDLGTVVPLGDPVTLEANSLNTPAGNEFSPWTWFAETNCLSC